MAKKKHRKRHQQMPQAPGQKVQARSSLIESGVKKSRTPNSTIRAIVFFVVLSLIGILIYFFFAKRTVDPAPEISTQITEAEATAVLATLGQFDFTGIESQVVEKIRNLCQEVSKNPESSSAWGKLAMNLDVHDLKNEAIVCYKYAAALDSAEFRWPYYCAYALDEMGSQEALSYYKRSLELKPDHIEARVRFGQALFQAKRFEEASQEFNTVLGLQPQSSEAHVGLARIALSKGDLENARSHLEKALQNYPQHKEAHGLLSEVYRRFNMPEKANQHSVISQRLSKKKPLTDPYELELIAEGVSSYWYEQRGRAYMEQGSHENAIRELELATQYATDHRLHTALGVAYLHSQKYSDAAKQLRTALELNPNSVYAMNNLAAALFELGKTEEAIQWLDKAIQVQPDFASSYDHLGKLYTRLGRKAEAMRVYQHGNQELPDDSNLALQLAWIFATSSDPSLRNGLRAVQLAEKVCKQNNYQDPKSLEVLAVAYAERANFEEATKTAENAYQLALASGQTQLAKEIQNQLKYYKSKKPIRQ